VSVRVVSFRGADGLWWRWVCDACGISYGSWRDVGTAADSARQHVRTCRTVGRDRLPWRSPSRSGAGAVAARVAVAPVARLGHHHTHGQ
jgi:hypothetical protein